MKRRILIGVFLATIIFSLTACKTGKDTEISNDEKVELEKSKTKSEDVLKNMGFVRDSYYGLSYYVPPEDAYYRIECDDEDTRTNPYREWMSISIGKEYYRRGMGWNDMGTDGSGTAILGISYYDKITDIKISDTTVESALKKVSDSFDFADKSRLIENDEMFFYVDYDYFNGDKEEDIIHDNKYYEYCHTYVLIKNTYDIYGVQIKEFRDEEFDDGEKFKSYWTKETWTAFLDTLEYVHKDDFIAEEESSTKEKEEPATARPTNVVKEDNLCNSIEGIVKRIVRSKVEYDTATTNIQNVTRHISDFTDYFVSDYDAQNLKGLPYLGSVIKGIGTKFTVDVTITDSNFDKDGFSYYKGSKAELNAAFDIVVHIWDDHDSSKDFTSNAKIYVTFVSDEYGYWDVKYLSAYNTGLDFTHIDDEDRNIASELLEDTSLSDWKQAYLKYFSQPDTLNFKSYDLVDVNSDGVPEICTDRQVLEGQGLIYVNKDKEVVRIEDIGSCEFRSSCVVINRARLEFGSTCVYKYSSETGNYNKVFSGSYTANISGEDKKYKIDNNECTESEYNLKFESIIDGSNIIDVNTEKYKVDTLLESISKY